jgi:hypothetical protein
LFSKCLTFPFVVFVVAGCIVYVLAVVVSFIVVFLYCVCALFVCNVRYLSVVLLYYCHRVKAQLQFNIYLYIYIYKAGWVGGFIHIRIMPSFTSSNEHAIQISAKQLCSGTLSSVMLQKGYREAVCGLWLVGVHCWL